MAINLFCYSSYSKIEAQSFIDAIENKHPNLFLKKFILGPVRGMDDQHRELVLDFNLVAHSFFLIFIADKSAVPELDEVARVVKTEFGETNVIVLYENETLM